MADHELDAVGDELVGDRDALLRIGDVVADRRYDLLAVDAAGRVDVGGGLLGALLELRAEGGVRTGDRTGDTDEDISPRAAAERHKAVRATADNSDFFIETLPLTEWAWMMLSCDAHPYRRKGTLPIFAALVTPIHL